MLMHMATCRECSKDSAGAGQDKEWEGLISWEGIPEPQPREEPHRQFCAEGPACAQALWWRGCV